MSDEHSKPTTARRFGVWVVPVAAALIGVALADAFIGSWAGWLLCLPLGYVAGRAT